MSESPIEAAHTVVIASTSVYASIEASVGQDHKSAAEQTRFAMWKALALLFLVWAGSFTRAVLPLSPLISHTAKATRLHFSTSELSGVRYWALFFAFIARSLANRVLGRRSLDVSEQPDGRHFLPGVGSNGDGISVTMPLGCSAVELTRYTDASGADKSEVVDHPLHSLLFLSAVTEPAMLLLLAKLNCSVDAVGSVNTRNRLEAVQPKLLREKLRNSVKGQASAGDLKVKARLDERVQKVKRGWEVTVVVELFSGQEALFRQKFAFLQSYRHTVAPAPGRSSEEDQTTQTKAARSATFSMNKSDPALWAALSKDYNPIHFVALAAKLFGFRARLAHGNHVLVKAITALDQAGTSQSRQSTTLEVELKRPVFLPADLDVSEVRHGGSGWTIEVISGGKEQVVGRY